MLSSNTEESIKICMARMNRDMNATQDLIQAIEAQIYRNETWKRTLLKERDRLQEAYEKLEGLLHAAGATHEPQVPQWTGAHYVGSK